MAWDLPSAPTTLTVITQAWGQQVVDSLAALSLHKHGGAAGDGDDELTPTKITLDDISDPSAPGANKTVVWAADGKLHQRAGAAGAAEEFSDTLHTHTLELAETQESASAELWGGTYDISTLSAGAEAMDAYTGARTEALTVGDAANPILSFGAYCLAYMSEGGPPDDGDITIRLQRDAVVLATSAYPVTAVHAVTKNSIMVEVSDFEVGVAAAGYTYTMDVLLEDDGVGIFFYFVGWAMAVSEVQWA